MKALLASVLGTKAKKILASFLLVSVAIALPLASLSAAAVKIEGSLGVANVTAGDTKYAQSVNAKFDQVVKFQVYYHNMELPDSGKIAENLNVKINIPSVKGKSQAVTATIGGTNTNTISSTATVNLDRDDAYLQYIPGSAVWKHNNGTNENVNIVEQIVSDKIVTDGAGLVLENAKPCYNFDATVTVLARVVVPAVSVDKSVRIKGESEWKTSNTAKPGDTLEYVIKYKNIGNSAQKNVLIKDNLPPGLTLVPGTTYLSNSTFPSGRKYDSDNVASGGIYIGDYGPGGAAYVKFEVKVPVADKLKCGETEYRNVGVAKPEGMSEYFNIAVTKVNKECEPPKPQSITCDALKVDILNNKTREVEAKVTGTANNTTITGYKIDFGDGTIVNEQTAKHTYKDYGKFVIKAHVSGMVNGKTVTVGGDGGCVKTVEFTKPPEPQSIACSALTVSILNKDNREVEAKVTGTASNTTITGYKIDFGDSTVVNQQTAKHTYGDYGKYTIKAYAVGTVDGKTVTVGGDGGCVKTVEFTKPEPPKQAITCDVLTLNILNNKTREVEAKVTGSAQNTTITGYKIDFGDGTVVNEQTAKHTFADYGKYTVKAHVSGTVDGKPVTVSSDGCVQMVEFKKPPEPTVQSIKCDALTLDLFNKDKKYVKVSVKATAQNTKIDKYSIDFGDGSTPASTQTAEHTYGDYGTYKIVAKVTGMVDGKEVTDSNVNCEQTVEFKKPGVPPVTPPPAELPNTGAGALLGLFSGVSILGAVGHRMWTIKKMQ